MPSYADVQFPEFTRSTIPNPIGPWANRQIILIEPNGTRSILFSDGAQWVSAGGGVSQFTALSDAQTAPIATANDSVKNALAANATTAVNAANAAATATSTANAASSVAAAAASAAAAKASLQTGSLAPSTTLAPNATAVQGAIDAAVAGVTAGATNPITTAYATAIPLDSVQGRDMGSHTMAADVLFTVGASPVQNGACALTIVGDGTHVITAPGMAVMNGGADPTTGVPKWFDKSGINEMGFIYRNSKAFLYGQSTPVASSTSPLETTAVVASTAPAVIVVTFDNPLDQTKDATAFASAFAVSAGHAIVSSAWGTSSTKLNLTTSTNFVAGESAKTLAFTQSGTVLLQDAIGNKVASFSGKAITNNAAALPTITGVVVNTATPSTIEVTLSENYTGSLPAASAFAISAGHTITAIAAGSTGAKINLTTSTAFVTAEAARTLAYTKPGSNPITGATSLQQLATVSGIAITNNVASNVTDTFDTNGTLAGATTSTGNSTWSVTSGSATVTAHVVEETTNPFISVLDYKRSDGTFDLDMTHGGTSYPAFKFRETDASNYWFVSADSSNVYLAKVVAGSQTTYNATPPFDMSGPSTFYKYRVILNGNSIQLWVADYGSNSTPVHVASLDKTDSFNATATLGGVNLTNANQFRNLVTGP